ncbi:MAG: phosphotransferase [Ilumatobacteraceae bacterium]
MTVQSSGSGTAPIDLDVLLSPEWLAAHIPGEADSAITGVSVVEKLKTVATKVRFRIDHADGAARHLCVKGYFEDPGRLSPGTGRTEANFYVHLAPSLSITIPHAVYAAFDAAVPHSVIVMDDLVAAGSVFFSALSPFSVEQSAATLDEMARFHAGHWGDTAAIGAMPWLYGDAVKLGTPFGLDEHQGLLDDPRTDGLPAALRDAAAVRRSYAQFLAAAGREVPCLVHADAHVGNLYRTPDDGIGIIDWQLVQSSWWALDVAYHVGAALPTDDREKSERDLVAHYVECLRRYGVTDAPDAEAAWRGYRMGLAYGYFLWSITRRVDPPITIEYTQRLGKAVTDHGSFELLEAS